MAVARTKTRPKPTPYIESYESFMLECYSLCGDRYGVCMDPVTASLVFTIAAWLLGTIISLLVLYLVIRLAVSHALRSHQYWLEEQGRR